MFETQPVTGAIASAVARGVDYEVSLADLARRSERRAWQVASAATAVAVLLAGGCLAMLPLKERVPFLVMADASSGTASVARLDESFRNRMVTASEAIARSNVAHFVTMRESYDLALINLRDWRAVHSMSAPQVGREYSALHARRNPESPYRLYGAHAAIRTRILSIALLDDSKGNAIGATIRFQRSVYDKRNGETRPLDSKIATLAFGYEPGLRMDERDRLENPLGFRVTSYRVENDYAASPPLAVDAPVMQRQVSAVPLETEPGPDAAPAGASGTGEDDASSPPVGDSGPPDASSADISAPGRPGVQP